MKTFLYDNDDTNEAISVISVAYSKALSVI